MTARLRVAIVVTLKNEEDTIRKQLLSILKQIRTLKTRDFNSKAAVRWRPPGDYRTVWRQFFNYARGDGQAGIYFKDFYWPKKFQLYIGGLILALAGLLTPVFLYILIALMLIYMTRPGAKVIARTSRPAALLTLGTIIVTRDAAEMAGYIKGAFERRQDPERFKWRVE